MKMSKYGEPLIKDVSVYDESCYWFVKNSEGEQVDKFLSGPKVLYELVCPFVSHKLKNYIFLMQNISFAF